ncbi:MAG: Transposase family protein, partial [Pedosphaera sp.]|nr:Transposase family protein [Pedosphaera sp.]
FPPHLLAQEEEGQNSRDRIFNLCLTVQCFLWQVLKPRTACREVVRQIQALFRLLGRGPLDEGTSAYCQARQRLPRERIERLLTVSAQQADRRAGQGGQLNGRPVKVVDASSAQAPDTKANQKRYPQSAEQKPGCGFPVIKFLLLFSLNSGAVLKVVMGSLHQHELRLLRQLQQEVRAGDILLGDRAYGEYTTLATLPLRGVDVVARLHQARRVDFRRARRLARNDGLFVWQKSSMRSQVLTRRQWRQVPDAITVRLIRFTAAIRGFRSRRITLVTTLLDPKLYPAGQLIGLYARRWRLELGLRDLKSTLGMEQLRCKTPDLAEKELLIYLLAHNLIRCLMAEAVARHQGDLQRVSFKGSVDALRQYSAAIASAWNRKMRDALWDDLLACLVRDALPDRPNRIEPRALKRRPKNFGWLTKPRHKFKESLHRNRYWKSKPRNYRALN